MPPKQGGASLRVSPNPTHMGPRGVWRPSSLGLVPFSIQPIRPSGRGGPSRWTPGIPPVAPVQYQYAPKPFRRPYDNFPYINLYLWTLLELLVTSGISSETANNIR